MAASTTMASFRAARGLRWGQVLALAVVLAMLPGSALADGKNTGAAGFIDPQMFIDLAGGEDHLRLQVSISHSLIKLLCAGLEAELKELICPLRSIDAVIANLGRDRSQSAKARDLVRQTEKRLTSRGWTRLALVREEDAEVYVLVLNDDESIRGLVVMVLDFDEPEVIFANVSGLLDLEAIQRIGDQWRIPGLEHLEGVR